jgi:GxxExxY protein
MEVAEMNTLALVKQDLTRQILDCAIEVHRTLGPGLLECAYRACLIDELRSQSLSVEQEVPVPLHYKGRVIHAAYHADLVINNAVLLEMRAVESLTPMHHAQVLTYLRFLNLKVGLLLNFNEANLMKGLRRLVLDAPSSRAIRSLG